MPRRRNSKNAAAGKRGRGAVHLVGAGPGDPQLLTLRALDLLRSADVIVHDHLVSQAVLDLANPAAARIYAGKERGRLTLMQEQINALLVRLAREGRQVLRLKGGDPFIFGRGGEEAEALADAGVSFEVVPGITAASGVAAYSGIPLTHRDYAHGCMFVAGHLKQGNMDLDWRALARPAQTVVVYMGLAGLSTLCRQLIAHGLSPDTPAAIVQHSTLPDQRTVVATLGTLERRVAKEKLSPPTLIIVGDVVRLQPKLAWFEKRPKAATSAAGRSGARPRTRRPRRAK